MGRKPGRVSAGWSRLSSRRVFFCIAQPQTAQARWIAIACATDRHTDASLQSIFRRGTTGRFGGMHHHPGSHDLVLVALSILIAALASYTALDLATRMRAASGSASLGWLGAAAVAMGGGIWSMHFVAMLAFSLPGVDISYDPLLTLLSLAIPILVAAAAFVVVSQRSEALVFSGI